MNDRLRNTSPLKAGSDHDSDGALSAGTQMLRVRNLAKSFRLHNQGGREIPVMSHLDLDLEAGDCVALYGVSGAGKSTLIRMIYGNYGCDGGSIEINHHGHWLDLATAEPRTVMDVRRTTLGYVSQFLRILPRVSTLEIVAEPARKAGLDRDAARNRAKELLSRVNLPEALWELSPTTFSGGEQQRVNIARGFAHPYPVLMLDEPTASLDERNRAVVLDLIQEARAAGTAILGIFHDADAREAVCNKIFNVESYRAVA